MSACAECLARSLLLAALAGHIDRSVDRGAGERARDLLALRDAELLDSVCTAGGAGVLRRTRSVSARRGLEAALERGGCWSVCRHELEFPAALARLEGSAPRALFGAGRRETLRALCEPGVVTIVGSRRAGAYGREVARDLGRLVGSSGITVLSGMALGVDSAAHEGALAGGGETVAILGAGADRPYPRSARALYRQIRTDGLVLSELPPDTPTFRWVFPARNRLMAALAELTVVVEAAERSGSLITAEMAADLGRQVGAVPGPVTSWRSSGTNRLLAEGAAVVRGAQDVLDQLLGPGARTVRDAGPPLRGRGAAILTAVEAGAGTPDAIASSAAVEFVDALAELGRLEADGYLDSDSTGRYTRTTLAVPTPHGGKGRWAAASTIGG